MPLNPPPLTSGRPRHEQVSDWLRERIRAGEVGPHDQLPSEHEVGEAFGVSRITVRRALQTLENEGRIYRRQGLGSFVAPPLVPQGLVRLTDFAQDMERAGLTASSEVRHWGAVPAPPPAAACLGLDAGATVIRLDRLRLGNDTPIAFDRTWLPPFYAQLLDPHDLAVETIYGILEREYDIPVLRGRVRIEAVAARDEEAEALRVPEGAPLLLVERTSFTTADRPIYYQRRTYRADRVGFDLELARDPEAAATEHAGMPLQEFEPVFKESDR
ncbi:MAG: GntR family transcriptional regulator [Bacteroidota bacterium]